MMDPFVINHLSDTDLYKITMAQCFRSAFPNEITEWEFKVRTKDVHLGYLADRINFQLDHLCTLRWTDEELNYLKTINFIKPDFIDWLQDLNLRRRQIVCEADGEDIKITAKGPDIYSSWFEIYLMSIVQQLWMSDQNINLEEARSKTLETIEIFNEAKGNGINFTVADMGARRRYSFDWHDWVIETFKKLCKVFVGTSDVYFAMKHGVKPIGTFAHQGYAITQGLRDVPVRNSQIALWDAWTRFYRGNLGIALSDNFGFNAFLEDFDLYYAKLFDGCRHDSGDPIKWGEMLIHHYEKLGIDPKTKIACWSDSLDANKAVEIAKYFNGKIKVSFGIGTFLTNNVGGKPLSMVMKVVRVNGKPVVKLSDAPGKIMCQDQEYIDYVKKLFNYKSIDESED